MRGEMSLFVDIEIDDGSKSLELEQEIRKEGDRYLYIAESDDGERKETYYDNEQGAIEAFVKGLRINAGGLAKLSDILSLVTKGDGHNGKRN